VTGRSYPALRERSPSGTHHLVSTKAGTTLRHATTGTTIWQRPHDAGAARPVAAWVADDGAVVLRCHSGDWATEELVLVDAAGRSRLTVTVGPPSLPLRDRVVWLDPQVRPTTAGPRWAAASLGLFAAGVFSLRTVWGRRLVVDRQQACLVASPTDALAYTLDTAETRRAMELLGADALDRDTLSACATTLAAHRVSDAVPLLREALAAASAGFDQGGTGHVFGKGERRCHTTRAVTSLALRRLGAQPSQEPAYRWTRADGPVPMAPRSTSASDAARHLPPGTGPTEVLAVLGAPDFVDVVSERVGEVYRWSEVWDYDGPEDTARLHWSMPRDDAEALHPRRLAEVCSVPAAERPHLHRLLRLLR